MVDDSMTGVRASRLRIPRSRGAVSGLLLVVLGAWAAVVPFIGPYLDFAFTPNPNDAWYWTAARGYLEVVPGVAALLGGLLLIVSGSRLVTSLGAWLAVCAGAWLIVGPVLADYLGIDLGTPQLTASEGVRELAQLFYFFATGAAIVLMGALAAGRLSVHGIRDVRAGERRAAREAEATEAPAAAERAPDAAPDPDLPAERHVAAPGERTGGGPDMGVASDPHHPQVSRTEQGPMP